MLVDQAHRVVDAVGRPRAVPGEVLAVGDVHRERFLLGGRAGPRLHELRRCDLFGEHVERDARLLSDHRRLPLVLLLQGENEVVRGVEQRSPPAQDLVARAAYHAMLAFSTATDDPARGAAMAASQERSTAIETQLIFFDLEWAAADDEHVDTVLADPRLDFCRHHLRKLRENRPYLLSEAEETILAEKGQTGAGAWARLFDELTSAVTVDLPDELVSEVEKCKDNAAVRQVGIEWAIQQSKELVEAGVPVLHYYSMGKSDNIKAIAKEVF